MKGVTLSVDCDASPLDARSALGAVLGKPTFAVASGGSWADPKTGEVERKCHLHWRLKVPTKMPADHELLREARMLAPDLVGGDLDRGCAGSSLSVAWFLASQGGSQAC